MIRHSTGFTLFARLRTVATCLALLGVAGLTACSDGSDTFIIDNGGLGGCADSNSCAANPPLEVGGDRLATAYIPSDYDPNTRYPLVVHLHGFGANGQLNSFYLGLPQRVDSKQFVLLTPDGVFNSSGQRFWNATDACCSSTDPAAVDDVAYLRGLIEEAAATYSIDTSRVALFGHSNGGFMSLRMACEASDLVTTVISLAGSTWDDEALCTPATYPVSVMALHGTADETIPYEGSDFPGFKFPGAVETAERFAVLGGCDPANTTNIGPIDLDGSVEGEETDRLRYENCIRGATVELWTINDGPHIPVPWTVEGMDLLTDWLIEHPR